MSATAMSPSCVDPRVATALVALVPRITACFVDPWWVIGSAAAHVTLAPEIAPHDIDVLGSAQDVRAFAQRQRDLLDDGYRPPHGARFRSRFVRLRFEPLPVELMGGLEVAGDGGWCEVRIDATHIVDCAGQAIPVPTPAEQIRLFELFGRPKDLDKARILRRLATESAHAA